MLKKFINLPILITGPAVVAFIGLLGIINQISIIGVSSYLAFATPTIIFITCATVVILNAQRLKHSASRKENQ